MQRFVYQPADAQEELERTVDAKVAAAERGELGVTAPLTQEEAALVDQRIDKLLESIGDTRDRVADTQKRIELQVAPKDGNELSFKLDIRKKPSLKRAIAAVFGVKSDTITYSMYKQCVELKRLLEEEESDNYVAGDWS